MKIGAADCSKGDPKYGLVDAGSRARNFFPAQPVTRLGAVLTHHDDRRLHGSQTRQNQIEEDERIGIEGMGHENDAVDADPNEKNAEKRDQESPTAAELRDAIGEAFAKRE